MVVGRIIIFRELWDSDKKAMQNFLSGLSERTLDKWRHYSGEIIDEIYKEPSHKLIGLDDGKIVAYGCLVPNDKYPDAPALGIVVADEYQGRGIGSFMMRELEKLAIEKSYKFIFLTTFKSNYRAFNLYKKVGYEVVDEVKSYGIPAYTMKKDIRGK
jgi:ribosomal protein S18 acetylase RimI-like enzyme